MLISEKAAMAQFLAVVGTTVGTSGFAAFVRTGSSASIPKTLMDLVATSRAAFEYKYQGQIANSNGLRVSQYTKGRSLLPLGGYGCKRTVNINGTPTVTCVAYPEFSRLTPMVGHTKTLQALLAQNQAAYDVTSNTPTWNFGEVVEYDFGRSLRFRSIFASSATAWSSSYFGLSYLDSATGTWLPITLTALLTDGLDFTARKIRITCKAAVSEFVSYQFYVEPGAAITPVPLTHVVLVPLLTTIASAGTYLSTVTDDYLGIVVDTALNEIRLDTAHTGRYVNISASDVSICIGDAFLEGV